MSKYTAEQFDVAAEKADAIRSPHAGAWSAACREQAAYLRERESAKAGVTDERQTTGTFECPICGYDKPHHHDRRLEPVNWHSDYRTIFEDVVFKNLHLVKMSGLFLGPHRALQATGQAHFLSMRADDARRYAGRVIEGCESHPWSEFSKSSPWNGGYEQSWLDDLWNMYKQFICAALEAVTPTLASARVPDGWSIGETIVTGAQEMGVWVCDGKNLQVIHPGDSTSANLPFYLIKAMLAAAPKPETEK